MYFHIIFVNNNTFNSTIDLKLDINIKTKKIRHQHFLTIIIQLFEINDKLKLMIKKLNSIIYKEIRIKKNIYYI